MNKIIKVEDRMDEFGNLSFQEVTYYHFDHYLFKYIKEFALPKKKEKYGIISLMNGEKYNIINQKINGLYMNEAIAQNYTEKEQIKIKASMFDIIEPIDKLLVKMREYDNVIVCDVFDVELEKKQTMIKEIFQLRDLELPPLVKYVEYDYVTYRKIDKIKGTFYLDKKKHNRQIEFTDNNNIINCYRKKTRIIDGMKQLKKKYGNHMEYHFDGNMYMGNHFVII